MPPAANQPELPLDHPGPILLPEVKLNLPFRKIGRIIGILKQAKSFQSICQQELPNRRTRTARILRDQDGRELLITTTKTDRNNPNHTEILLDQNSRLSWLKNDSEESIRVQLLGEERSGIRESIRASWIGAFRYRDATLSPDGLGLRPPQIGALYAALSHWTLSNEPVTVVMPTGTGKTETMLSLLVTAQPECMLVVVPSKTLREQTADKFATLGILPSHGLLDESARGPIVGILEHQVGSDEALKFFERCNVIVAVIDSIAMGKANEYLSQIAERCSHLVFDEAHHVAAKSWTALKNAFHGKPIIQFTATPFREDRSPLGGKQIYNYPLHRAQEDGYFKPIRFKGVFEVDRSESDRSIARKAVAQLNEDFAAGFDHRLLARCRTKDRAQDVLAIYQELAPNLSPVLIHSGESGVDERIASLRSGTHKIVVTVNMLAEGFDMPELKVAAVHDIFKSLAITLQFTGRFPRVGGSNVGDPTIIANTGFTSVASSLQSLYDEDPDWNDLLANLSFERIEEEQKFNEFLRNARELGDIEIPDRSIAAKLTPQSLIPRYNAVVYRAHDFHPHRILDGLDSSHRFVRGWVIDDPLMVFFITRIIDRPKWTKSKMVEDSVWNLTSLYHDRENKLLYIGSSASSATNHQALADAVIGTRSKRFQGEEPFRIFDGIQRLLLQQVGLLSTGSRNHRYSMFAGGDVKDAISRILRGRAQKSNIFGAGFRDGGPIDFGCSRKGKIWGRDFGSLSGWREWCDELGTRLLDETIDTGTLIENVLVAKPQDALPDKQPWFIDWPEKLLPRSEGSFGFLIGDDEIPFRKWGIELIDYVAAENRAKFRISHESNKNISSEFRLTIKKDTAQGHNVEQISGPDLRIRVGRETLDITEYFNDYVPPITFTDQSVLEGCQLVEPRETLEEFPINRAEALDWNGVNIRKESYLKNGQYHKNSVQAFAIERCLRDGFQLVFDDDGANEIADIVAMKDTGDRLVIRLVHCKYSGGDSPGGRIGDVVDVSSQAVKNCRWFWNIDRLAKRMIQRDKDRTAQGYSRFLHGNANILRKVARLSELSDEPIREAIVVQPGLSKAAATTQIISILGSADSYLRMAAGCPLQVWCSP